MDDVLVKTNLTAVVAPGITDDSGSGYSIFSPWLDVTADELYWCMDASVGAAVWLRVTNLTAAEIEAIVNHDNLVGFVAAEHVDWATSGAGTIHATNYVDTTDHTLLSNIGTNTHAQLDTHVALTAEHLDWTADQGATNIDAGNLPVAAITSGTVTGITDLAIADGGTASSTAQAAIDLLTAVSGATIGWVLTKSAGGNAVFEASAGGGLANIVEDITPQLGAQLDVNGFGLGDGTLELLSFVETVSAINEITITNAAIGNDPDISATGDDPDIGISFTPKGTGNITLGTMVLDSDQTIGAGQDNYVLTYDDTGGLISLEAAAGGAATAGGSDTEVQYNNGTVLGGMVNVTYNDTTTVITIGYADELSGLVASGTDTDALDLTIKVPVSTGTADPGAVIIQTTDLIGAISGTTPQTLQDRFRFDGPRMEVLNTDKNIFIGEGSGVETDATRTGNVGIGFETLDALTTGDNNIAIGDRAFTDVNTGLQNVAVGNLAGFRLQSGSNNFALGSSALFSCVTGSANVAIGQSALNATTGGNSVAIGASACAKLTGGGAVAIGSLAFNNQVANAGTAVGFQCLRLSTGSFNTAVGRQCADNVTTGSQGLFFGHIIDAQSATASNQMSIGNLLFSEGIDGTGTTVSTGNLGVAIVSPQEKLQVPDSIAISDATEGNTARLTRRTAHETHTLAAAGTSDTTTISIPSGARLLGVSFNVDTVVVDDAGDDTWSAAFVTGSTTPLATAATPTLNTKVDLMLPDEISTGVCEIRFTANAGNFSAGVIEIVAYYEELTSLANV